MGSIGQPTSQPSHRGPQCIAQPERGRTDEGRQSARRSRPLVECPGSVFLSRLLRDTAGLGVPGPGCASRSGPVLPLGTSSRRGGSSTESEAQGLTSSLVGVDAGEAAACAVCGRRIVDVDGGADWLHLEVTRGELPEAPEYVDASFCTQAHAAEWLSRPLPASPPSVPMRADRRERLYGVAFSVCAVWAVGLMLLGAHALVRLLGGWD